MLPTTAINPSDSLAEVCAKVRIRAHSASLFSERSFDRVMRKESSSAGVSAGMNVSAMERNVSSWAGVKVRWVVVGGMLSAEGPGTED